MLEQIRREVNPQGALFSASRDLSYLTRGRLRGSAMFIGHYGPAAACAGKRVKLWHGFVAVQFLDILWAPFILLGVEKARIVKGFTAYNDLDLYFMPYTHSLFIAAVWSVLAAGFYMALRKSAGVVGGVIIGGLVFSHWILDYITHKPDLELWVGGPKVGLGLWDNLPLALAAEIVLVLGGFLIYLTKTKAKKKIGAYAPWVMLALLFVAQLYNNFGPVPASANSVALSAIAAYVLFAALAAWVDGTRAFKRP